MNDNICTYWHSMLIVFSTYCSWAQHSTSLQFDAINPHRVCHTRAGVLYLMGWPSVTPGWPCSLGSHGYLQVFPCVEAPDGRKWMIWSEDSRKKMKMGNMGLGFMLITSSVVVKAYMAQYICLWDQRDCHSASSQSILASIYGLFTASAKDWPAIAISY